MIGAGFRTKTFFPLLFGGVFGGIPFLMSLVPFFNASPIVLVPWALVLALVGNKKGAGWDTGAELSTPSRSWRSSKSSRRSGATTASGWSFGADSSSSSGSSSSSSSGGSSDSFGGGSSGGGGASGSW
jgi:hypothetical protein